MGLESRSRAAGEGLRRMEKRPNTGNPLAVGPSIPRGATGVLHRSIKDLAGCSARQRNARERTMSRKKKITTILPKATEIEAAARVRLAAEPASYISHLTRQRL